MSDTTTTTTAAHLVNLASFKLLPIAERLEAGNVRTEYPKNAPPTRLDDSRHANLSLCGDWSGVEHLGGTRFKVKHPAAHEIVIDTAKGKWFERHSAHGGAATGDLIFKDSLPFFADEDSPCPAGFHDIK